MEPFWIPPCEIGMAEATSSGELSHFEMHICTFLPEHWLFTQKKCVSDQKVDTLTRCLMDNFSNFFAICGFFSKSTFSKNLSGMPSECQTVWIQIWPDALSGLIRVQPICIGYQQMTLEGKELNLQWHFQEKISSSTCKSMQTDQVMRL